MLRAISSKTGSRSLMKNVLLKRTSTIPYLTSQKRSIVTGTDNFLSTSNAQYIDEMFEAWQKDPSSVHVSWNAYFKNLKNNTGAPASTAFQAPPILIGTPQGTQSNPLGVNSSSNGVDSNVNLHLKVQLLCRAYQVRGHLKAHIDPLKISFGDDQVKPTPPELTIEYYGFTKNDLDREITLGPGILPRFAKNGKSTMTLGNIIKELESLYCKSYGIQYTHIPSKVKCEWLRDRIEIPDPYKYTIDQKRQILDRLIWSTSFESFLSTKFPNDKRFGLEGLEAVVPGIKTLIDRSVELGVEDVVLGMAHRGRLNVLSNVVRKPNESIFAEFKGSTNQDTIEGSGDVKYHLGMNYQRPTTSGKYVNLSLVANPSHLEAQDPVVLGRTRALLHDKNDLVEKTKALGVLLHGDAAFAGQGVVYETMGFLTLPEYSTGGTIHVITNNQIGFTTDPRFSRSTPYPSDLAKAIDAPIFHCNANDIEAVTYIFHLAAEWRATFHTDAIIDIVGWRKHGHNETDQPAFTQPLMYQKIAQQENVIDTYTDKLIKEGSFTKKDIDEHKKWVWGLFEDAFEKAKEYVPTQREWLTAAWEGFKSPKELATEILPHEPTNVDETTLKSIGKTISSWPENFDVHRNLKRILNNRGKTIETGEGIDWATGEALAYGTLMLEGNHVRVSGEDVERGTFSQRHAVLHDQKSEATYTPLKHLDPKQSDFTISNSSLSEYGVMGFEYGYSLTSPEHLVVWEAQFGDFANTAQVIIDQFIAGGEQKWKQRSGLVLSLPHGYDGQGPEHSSGRLERFLQMANEDPRFFPSDTKLQRQHQDCNFQVVYPTTPANLFHILRRQQHRQFRKPLALFFSKQLLRHPLARSNLSEFTEGGFQWIIEDVEHGKAIGTKEETKKLVLLSGQVYTALHKKREELGDKTTAFLKIEELHPFPFAQLRDTINSYPNLEEIIWCQEEPLNMGSWSYVSPRLQTTLKETENYKDHSVRYCGRNPSGAVAAGNKTLHTSEENAFLKDVFGQ
ncbi:similar to Saccharomyces cerevisiae YIL125W KGD1 Component of the mitochondrial alpha-ketoglutarate dehydrogenase complex [Maudiozyma saulgeensis]|uniref:2-oxoglutarate dehydrogenase, mitochondrial n=1 Tax=Maudiozyma saulgeensis TaxID=1789683 RepID=A0A1X7R506_9SACH|nr:similar to Saccharomyces cerevisiae YIL125W KGD1 Component of the mitochondrial alpha-ketoglutarate dehydrogenase complex [Kazachstania saulgeensis]